MDLVVGLDSGTTATKAVAVAADATVSATCSAGYPLLQPKPGYAELDSVRLQEAAVEALAGVCSARREQRVTKWSGSASVGPCMGWCRWTGAVPPTGPLITWADSRAAEQSRSLALGSQGQLHKRTGTPIHPCPHFRSCCGGGSITRWFSPPPPSGAVSRRWCCPDCARTRTDRPLVCFRHRSQRHHRPPLGSAGAQLAGIHAEQLATVGADHSRSCRAARGGG